MSGICLQRGKEFISSLILNVKFETGGNPFENLFDLNIL